MENNNIVFVADIGADIDDMIAVEYLHNIGYLKCMVLDGSSTDNKRVNELKNLGVIVCNEIPEDTKIIFCGGSFTKIAKFIESHELELLVANGGFAGCNIVNPQNQLEKFKGKKVVRTFNLNIDINSGLKVFETNNIKSIYLVSKNVCHSIVNVHNGIHNDEFLNKYDLKPGKRLHDLLMVKEGINILTNNNTICNYLPVDYILEREKSDSMCRWGSSRNDSSHIKISVCYSNGVNNEC